MDTWRWFGPQDGRTGMDVEEDGRVGLKGQLFRKVSYMPQAEAGWQAERVARFFVALQDVTDTV